MKQVIAANSSMIVSILGMMSVLTTGIIYHLNNNINKRVDSANNHLDKKVSNDTFKIYVESNARLMDEHTEACRSNRKTMEKIFDKLDGKQDKI